MAFDHEWGPQPPILSVPLTSAGAERIAPDGEKEMIECEACHEEKTEGESVVVHTHRVEGRAVAQDTEWVCQDCIDAGEEVTADRMMEARQWRHYDAWEARAHGGV